MKFKIGCDPEIFLLNGNNFKSVIGLIGGNKWEPRPLTDKGHAVLEDNVAVEFNIPPCDSLDDFRKEINFTMEKIKEILPQELTYSQESAVSFPQAELDCEAAWLFGCEPDLDAWNLCENPKPNCEDKNLRSAGGHIHVGSDIACDDPIAVVRAMDLFLGVPSINLDSGTLRRSLYGKAGAMRLKGYGVEYRTLSNFWIFDNSLIDWAYEGTKRALEFVAGGNTISEEVGHKIQNCINNSDQTDYEYLARTYGLV